VRVTDLYGIAGPVPFLDVHVDRDNLLFLDPSAIRNATDPLGRRAHDQLRSFVDEVLRCRVSPHQADRDKGLALMQQLHEPNQTRLGMSEQRVAGHGFGDELGGRLWDELRDNRARQAAALTRLEDLRLFVDGVGNDLVSDLTTRVVFDVLADFSQQMMIRYPSLTRGQRIGVFQVWDRSTTAWASTAVTLPYVTPHQLLLVPKGWVFWRTLMDPYAFYNRYGTETVQRERTKYSSRGRKLAPSKAALKGEFPHVRGLNIQQAVKCKQHDEDLVAAYRQWVDAEYEPLTDHQLDRFTT